ILLSLCPAVLAQDGFSRECLAMRRMVSTPTAIINRIQTSEVISHVRRFADQQTTVPGADTYLLKEGTEVSLKFAQDLSSRTAAEDDRVNFELADDLKV